MILHLLIFNMELNDFDEDGWPISARHSLMKFGGSSTTNRRLSTMNKVTEVRGGKQFNF